MAFLVIVIISLLLAAGHAIPTETTTETGIVDQDTVPPEHPIDLPDSNYDYAIPEKTELKIKKCCGPDQVYLADLKKCVDWDDSNNPLDLYPLDPAFVDITAPVDYYDYEGGPAPTPYVITSHGQPSCSNEQEVKVLVNADNDPEERSFLITANALGEYDLIKLADVKAEQEYCLERSFVSSPTTGKVGRYHGTAAMYCKTRDEIICKNKPCVRSCCTHGFVFDADMGSCRASFNDSFLGWVPKLVDLHNNPVETKTIEIFHDELTCDEVHTYDSRFDKFWFNEAGKLNVVGNLFNWTQYCVRYVEVPGVGENGKHEYFEQVRKCTPNPKIEDPLYVIMSVRIVPSLFVVSLCFLALLFIYLLKRNRHKLFGIMTLCQIFSLFMFYLMLCIPQLVGKEEVKYTVLCQINGFLIQFFYLAAVFWLNAMSFDIWSTFRQVRRAPENEPKGWRNPRFKWYSLYAWGCPTIVLIVTITMQYLPEEVTEGFITPGIGRKRCFLFQGIEMLVYFHAINAPVILSNVVLFFGSMWNLCCGVWAEKRSDPVVRQQNNYRYKTVIKLFFAMGITWAAEIISWALGFTYGDENVWKTTFIFDIINALQGFIIFCILVFDTATINKIKRRFGWQPKPAVGGSSKRSGKARAHRTTTTSLSSLTALEVKGDGKETLRMKALQRAMKLPFRKNSGSYELTKMNGNPEQIQIVSKM